MKKRTVAILMACTLILGATVGVTFAWLISGPKAVVNTFVAGKVAITLDEAKVDKSGTAASGAQRVQKNEYTLIPGHSYDKDPTVHIEAGSEPCYVFVKVQNGISTIESSTDGISIGSQMTANGWEVLSAGAGTNGIVYYFKTNTGKNTRVTVDANGIITVPSGNNVDLVVFEKFTISGTTGNQSIKDFSASEIKVTAYAIQALGSASAEEAWTNGGFN